MPCARQDPAVTWQRLTVNSCHCCALHNRRPPNARPLPGVAAPRPPPQAPWVCPSLPAPPASARILDVVTRTWKARHEHSNVLRDFEEPRHAGGIYELVL